MKTLTSTILGSLIGATISPIATITNMCLDLTAPISYPTLGVITGVTCYLGAKDNGESTLQSAAMGLGCFVGMTSLIPISPILLATRPVTTPLTFTIVGGGAGYFINKEMKVQDMPSSTKGCNPKK